MGFSQPHASKIQPQFLLTQDIFESDLSSHSCNWRSEEFAVKTGRMLFLLVNLQVNGFSRCFSLQRDSFVANYSSTAKKATGTLGNKLLFHAVAAHEARHVYQHQIGNRSLPFKYVIHIDTEQQCLSSLCFCFQQFMKLSVGSNARGFVICSISSDSSKSSHYSTGHNYLPDIKQKRDTKTSLGYANNIGFMFPGGVVR